MGGRIWQTESWYLHGCYCEWKVFTPADFSLQSRILSSHCTITTSYLKCFIIRLHCSMMIFYLKRGNLRLWNFSFLLLWRFCYNKHVFHFSLHHLFCISLYENFRKIKFYFPTESFIYSAAENTSALWHFICSYALFNCSGDVH